MAAKKKSAKPVRKDPSPALRTAVLTEAGYKCGNPACRNILVLELHHIHWVSNGGPTEAWNLLALCPMCHGLHTQGKIPDSAIKHWKGLLVALNAAFSRESTELLLFLDEPSTQTVINSGDALVRFAGLMAAKLVEITKQSVSVGQVLKGPDAEKANARFGVTFYRQVPQTTMRIQLTEKGKLLVDSWKKGDQAEYLTAMGIQKA